MRLILLMGLALAAFAQTLAVVPDHLPPHAAISDEDAAMYAALEGEQPTLMHIRSVVERSFTQFGADYNKAAADYQATTRAYLMWDRQTESGGKPKVQPVKDQIAKVVAEIHDLRDRLAKAITNK